MNSIERALRAEARGWSAGPSPCSITRQATPRKPRSAASARPTGPAPTIRIGISAAVRGAILADSFFGNWGCEFAERRGWGGIFIHPGAETRAARQQAGSAAALHSKKKPRHVAGQD